MVDKFAFIAVNNTFHVIDYSCFVIATFNGKILQLRRLRVTSPKNLLILIRLRLLAVFDILLQFYVFHRLMFLTVGLSVAKKNNYQRHTALIVSKRVICRLDVGTM